MLLTVLLQVVVRLSAPNISRATKNTQHSRLPVKLLQPDLLTLENARKTNQQIVLAIGMQTFQVRYDGGWVHRPLGRD